MKSRHADAAPYVTKDGSEIRELMHPAVHGNRAQSLAEATVPRLTVIIRKAYGGAYLVMNSKHLRADVSFAWPTAEIAVMGPDGAVNIIFRKELVQSHNPEATKAELVADYRERFASPYKAAELGYIDEVIMPSEARPKVIKAFEMLKNKRDTNPPRKHGNIPL